MIEYLNSIRQMTITCDVCREDFTFFGIWKECIIEAKEEGWRMYKNAGNDWTHICPVCVQDGMTPEKRLDNIFPPTE